MKEKESQENCGLYIGVMSGTSIDGIDIALVEINQGHCTLKGSYLHPIAKTLKEQLSRICASQTPDDRSRDTAAVEDQVELLGQLDQQLGLAFAEGINRLLSQNKLNNEKIRAIGSHGQTIRHRPNQNSAFTLQIADPNLIAYHTGITTVADFRRMDMAAGGQGAPLVPAFHHALMKSEIENRIILNLGGIANLTYLPKSNSEPVIGFDTGPANTLLDANFKKYHPERSFDSDGAFSRQGKVDHRLLALLLSDPYFELEAPKSTGREYFSPDWLQRKLAHFEDEILPQSLQATLLELTTQTIINEINKLNIKSYQLYVCGGGMHNGYLMERLTSKLHQKIFQTNELGVDGDFLEAMTFAWLAHRRLKNLTGNLPSVTGAKEKKVLGAIYHP